MAEFEFPDKLRFLLTHKARYKVAYGGRGGAKSWSFAKAIILLMTQKPLRVLCAREFQNSLADSAYKLLSDIIREHNLEGFFEIMHDSIRCANGGEVRFMGIMTNPSKIKSFEGIDIVYVMEAARISMEAMRILTPTIRKPGSEIWIEFNPENQEDYIYQTFVMAKVKPPRSIVVEINYPDNPWFPEVLREQMEHDKKTDFDNYLHVWLGKPIRILTGAVYADEIRLALEQNRVTAVPHTSELPVMVFFDLGWSDRTALWFVQKVGMEYAIIDYYENRQKPIRHYLQILQGKEYTYGALALPHDATAKALGTGMSIQEIIRKAGYKVIIVPRLSILDGINAVREVFGRCHFDELNTKKGFDALCAYHWNDKIRAARSPVHDDSSHGADGFRYFAVTIERGLKIANGNVTVEEPGRGWDIVRNPPAQWQNANSGDSWMGH